MSIVYILIPLSLILASFFVWLFFKSVNDGQFQDLETPGRRIVFDEQISQSPKISSGENA
jgi:cbb3-type cytochrome oxidase maturation protein